MHYCDFCGKKINYGAKYCRHCGLSLTHNINDTQPLPVINDTVLVTSNNPKKAVNFNHNIWSRQIQKLRVRRYAILFYLASFITTIGLIYVLVTFKTVYEYQLLTAVSGFLLVVYFWRNAIR